MTSTHAFQFNKIICRENHAHTKHKYFYLIFYLRIILKPFDSVPAYRDSVTGGTQDRSCISIVSITMPGIKFNTQLFGIVFHIGCYDFHAERCSVILEFSIRLNHNISNTAESQGSCLDS